jgi:signal transduction histidine kinase
MTNEKQAQASEPNTFKAGSSLGAGQAFAMVLQDCVRCALIYVGADGQAESLNQDALPLLDREGDESVLRLRSEIMALAAQVREQGKPAQGKPILAGGDAGLGAAGLTAAPVGSRGAVVVAVNRFSPAGPLEPDLKRLDRLASIGTISAGMAHEVKNALVAVKTFVDLFLEKQPDAELAAMVRTEMGRIDSIVGRLLKFARPAPPLRKEVSLHETLEYALRLLHPQLSGRAIAVRRSFRAEPDCVMGDESQLQQAFVNVLLNSCEAIGTGGALTVSTVRDCSQAPPGFIRIDISDSGPGIIPAHMARMFEPFFTTKPDGTGLGLAITRRIVLDHGGNISVHSQERHGACLSISLPAQ